MLTQKDLKQTSNMAGGCTTIAVFLNCRWPLREQDVPQARFWEKMCAVNGHTKTKNRKLETRSQLLPRSVCFARSQGDCKTTGTLRAMRCNCNWVVRLTYAANPGCTAQGRGGAVFRETQATKCSGSSVQRGGRLPTLGAPILCGSLQLGEPFQVELAPFNKPRDVAELRLKVLPARVVDAEQAVLSFRYSGDRVVSLVVSLACRTLGDLASTASSPRTGGRRRSAGRRLGGL